LWRRNKALEEFLRSKKDKKYIRYQLNGRIARKKAQGGKNANPFELKDFPGALFFTKQKYQATKKLTVKNTAPPRNPA
jgi:hypothetical protein